MHGFKVHSWPALPFIVPVVSLPRFAVMVGTLKGMTGSAAVTATECFSSLTLTRPVNREPKWPSTVPEFVIPPGH